MLRLGYEVYGIGPINFEFGVQCGNPEENLQSLSNTVETGSGKRNFGASTPFGFGEHETLAMLAGLNMLGLSRAWADHGIPHSQGLTRFCWDV